MQISFSVDKREYTINVSPIRRLIDILREELKISAVKEGCGEGECGACSVILDGTLVNSCLIPAGQLEGVSITTSLGLAETERGKVLQRAFAQMHSVQCGFCSPGIYLAADTILAQHPYPTERAIREGISGNLCRCTGYDTIIDGILSAAELGRGLW